MNTLEITTRVSCPVNCSFCPQDKLSSKYDGAKMMTLDVFEKCLLTVPKTVRIDFSGFAEPLANPDAGHMMLLARKLGHDIHLFTTLVGLNMFKLAAIKESRPSSIRIHVPDAKAMLIADSAWIQLHNLFLESGLSATYMAMGEMTPKVAEHMSRLGITVELPQMLSRGGLVDSLDTIYIKGKIRCAALRWHMNVCLPNGDVQACCMSYDLSMPLGNLLRQPYSEIESKANEYEANDNPPEDSICRSCDWCAPK